MLRGLASGCFKFHLQHQYPPLQCVLQYFLFLLTSEAGPVKHQPMGHNHRVMLKGRRGPSEVVGSSSAYCTEVWLGLGQFRADFWADNP